MIRNINQDNLNNVWKKLNKVMKSMTQAEHFSIEKCRCFITQQQTLDPILWIIGTFEKQQIHLNEIMDNISFFDISFNFTKAN